MNRRNFIAAGVSGVSLASAALAAADEHAGHAGHGKAKGDAAPAATPWLQNGALIDAAADCQKAGTACLEHCLSTLRAGDKSMARCSETVSAMLPMCRALESLAAQGSPHLKALAALCAKVCRDCEVACKEHAGHHDTCKRCMESCQKCAAACEKLAA
jgi:Cys-rich four helix bundle protein (predicted Tat secretion target)